MTEATSANASRGSTAATVSIIVPAWNARESIGRCLEAILAQTFPRERTQIIIVDNGSTDETASIVRSFEGVLLLTEPVASSYRARNLGLAHATGDFIAFTDADCEPAPEWIESAVRFLQERGDVAVAAGRVQLVPQHDTHYSAAAHLYEQMFAFRQDEAARLGRSVTANWMSPRWVFDKFGTFNPELKSGGDWDLSARISDSGLPIEFVPEMLVYHPTRSNIGDLVAKRRRIAGGLWVRKGKWRGIPLLSARLTVEALTRSAKALLAVEYPLKDRLKLVALLFALAAVGVFELVHLQLGAEPRRA